MQEKAPKDGALHVAVIGTGIAGLSTALALAQQGCKVSVFEKEDRLGGHSFTYPGEGDRPPVDLGFQVMNNTTYPYLTTLFDSLGVITEPSDMSFAFSVDDGRVEWSSDVLFAQSQNARDPGFLYMIREIFRFAGSTEVLDETKSDEFESMTLGEYLDMRGYSQRFRSDYLLPTTAAIWSVPNQKMEQYPIKPLVAFMANHHLLSPLGERPRWRVVADRSKTYVDVIAKELERLGASIRLNAPVKSVRYSTTENASKSKSVKVTYTNGSAEQNTSEETFDHVVLATHSDLSTAMLGEDNAEAKDREQVSKIRYQPNRVILHSDASQMPRERSAWASWNVLDKRANVDDDPSARDICVTYWLNHLQNLPESAPLLLCTLNPIAEPEASSVIYETVLDHPIFDTDAMQAQREINKTQAKDTPATRSIWFAGAWLGSGFHEDGIRSALAVCKSLTGDVPLWAQQAGAPEHPGLKIIRGPSPDKTIMQRFGLQIFQSVAKRGLQKGYMQLMLPDGNDATFGRSSYEDAKARGEPAVRMRILDLGMMFKCIAESDIGLGEAYINRMFDVDDLPALFDLLIVNNETLRETLNPLGLSANSGLASFVGAISYCIGNVIENIRHLGNDNTVTGSRRNIESHYDAGNDMYKLFLDKSLTYSCGLHRREYGAENAKPGEILDLHEAQLAKLDSIIKKAQLKPSDHVLEIGCGWGSFAIRAASTVGCKVTGITISTEQLAEARERVREAGLEDKVNLIIFDYRKMGIPKRRAGKGDALEYERDLAPGHFDKIVSIEMLEAVGHDHLPEYFETVDRMLKPGGIAVIQVISLKDERYEEYRRTSDFIRRFIFPGGHLPCHAAIKWASDPTSLVMDQVDDIGPDYAVTLRMWRENFIKKHDEIRALGYPETFFRCFDMYFAYCEAGFQQNYIHNYHLVFKKDETLKKQERDEKEKTQLQALYNRTLVPAVFFSMSLIGCLSLTLNPTIRQVVSICCSAGLFTSICAYFLPQMDPAMDTSSRRANHYIRLVFVRFLISAAMCAIVLGLIAFHEVLYTTRVARAGLWTTSSGLGGSNSNVVASEADDSTFNLSTDAPQSIYFCEWGSDETLCQTQGGTSASSMIYVHSPMHFVVGCLAFASVSRLLLERNLMNMLHALALLVLNVLSHSSDTKTSTTALGLAIVHGASELHAAISAARTLLSLKGFSWSDNLYHHMWTIDISSLLIIRWIPVPVLLSPVILRSPWPVFISICLIAIRECSVLLDTLLALKEDYENRLNAEDLLSQARNRGEIVNNMVGSHESQQTTAAHGSAIYHGTVYHQRNKVEGASNARHVFKYNVWMSLVDLAEVKHGKAFQNSMFVSANKPNFFCWYRKDHFIGPAGPEQPLDECIRDLVLEQTGRKLSTEGNVLLLTNIRCFGFAFNPVSVFYCVDPSHTRLEAVVLEVSNTPWLQKRMYVIPFDHADEDGKWRSKWRKDFHVSPFFDVFYNYEWSLDMPGDTISVRAVSTRRDPDTDGAEEAPARKGEPWNQKLGTAPTQILSDEERNQPDGPRTFIAGVNLKRSSADEQWRQLLTQPLLTISIVLYIHIHAVIVTFRKGCEQKLTPVNAPAVGLVDALRHLSLFAVAGVAGIWSTIVSPFTGVKTK